MCRWPLRLFGFILLLVLAWWYPWPAFAVMVLAATVFLVVITPHMHWAQLVTQPIAAGLAVGVWLLCYLLVRGTPSRPLPHCMATSSRARSPQPYTCAFLAVAGFLAFVVLGIHKWFGLGLSVTVALFYFYPHALLTLLGVACWLLFVIIMPKLILPLSELVVTLYYYPFGSLFWCALAIPPPATSHQHTKHVAAARASHLAFLGALFAYESPVMLAPLGIFLLLFWFFPRVVGALLGLALVWLLFPLLNAARTHLRKLVEHPYGKGIPPDKVSTGEGAVRCQRRHPPPGVPERPTRCRGRWRWCSPARTTTRR